MSHPGKQAQWMLLLAALLLTSACGDPATPQQDASLDASDPADAVADAEPDAALPADAGALLHFDAGTPPCEAPGYFDPHASRISLFHMSPYAWSGWGLDMDNDPSTCTPTLANCCCGVDNQLGGLNVEGCWSATITADGFNDQVMDGIIIDGDPPVNYLLEARGLTMNGLDSAAPFTLVLHEGQWFPSAECTDDGSVLDDTLRCDYLSSDEMYQPGTCDAVSTLPGAEIINGQLVAGGPSHTIWIAYTALGLSAGVVIHQARMVADVTVNGDAVTMTNGILAGVICPAELLSVLNAVLTMDPACGLETKIPAPDLEVGCSADNPDGISLAFVFEAHAARIVGLLRN